MVRAQAMLEKHPVNRHRAALTSRIALAAISGLVLIGIVLWAASSPNEGANRLTVYGVFVEGAAGVVVVLSYSLVTISLSTVGAILSSRVSRNPIGWILLGLGLWASLTFFLATILAYLASTDLGRAELGDVAAWLGNWTFVPLNTVPLTFILMLVPNGRLASPRWRVLPWLATIGVAAWCVAQMFAKFLGVEPRKVPNPFVQPTVFRIADLLTLILGVAFLGGVASIVVRYRRAHEEERQQIKWVTFGGLIEVTVTLALWLLSAVRPSSFGATVIAFGGVAGLITPASIAVAIFRYRLYEIDRLISRTLAYTLVVGSLALVYISLTIGLPAILQLPVDSPLMVAAATLAAAALFRPLSRRLQALVDRRFNRTRYDSQREIDLFTLNLGRTVDLEHVLSETSDIIRRTVEPDEVAVWIRST